MRTHIYNKLTAQEIEDYFASGRDAIFIALGPTEIHGEMPVDCEDIRAEGFAVAMAEKTDSLALVNLPFFYAGGTLIGRGTVHTTLVDGIQYLTMLCRSLVDQGFKKLFLVPGHSSIMYIANAFTRDFFEAAHIHPCCIYTGAFMKRQAPGAGTDHFKEFEAVNCGAYKIMKQVQYLPIDPNAVRELGEILPNDPELDNFAPRIRALGGAASLVFSHTLQHGGGLVFRTEEERDAACERGERVIREAVDTIDFEGLFKALDDYQAYAQRMAQKFPRFNHLV